MRTYPVQGVEVVRRPNETVEAHEIGDSLSHSQRDYLDQLEVYKRFQGK